MIYFAGILTERKVPTEMVKTIRIASNSEYCVLSGDSSIIAKSEEVRIVVTMPITIPTTSEIMTMQVAS